VLTQYPNIPPSELLQTVNKVIYDNVQKLGDSKYMTITVLAAIQDGEFYFSGLHQDMLIYRTDKKEIESIETNGMWIGLMDSVRGMNKDEKFKLNNNDVLLLYTDGITESWKTNSIKDNRGSDEMFSEDKLKNILLHSGERSTQNIKNSILLALDDYRCDDDVTFVIIKKVA
jgi:serine phosphatase RsbU (regulator of sigma subunit)